VGFAVPINLAKWVGDQLVSTGSVHRAFLGVGVQELTSALSRQFGMVNTHGALVTDVRTDSPAAKAGLTSGDVIVEFDGQAVTDPRDLQRVVERSALKTEHSLVVLRDGKRLTLKAAVEELRTELTSAVGPSTHGEVPHRATSFQELGLQVANLNAEEAQQLGMKKTDGVLITGVTNGSAAEVAGLEEGMVIAKVGQTPVKTVDEFRQEVQGRSLKDGLLLLVRTGNGSQFVVLHHA
jgi:serine protease Do